MTEKHAAEQSLHERAGYIEAEACELLDGLEMDAQALVGKYHNLINDQLAEIERLKQRAEDTPENVEALARVLCETEGRHPDMDLTFDDEPAWFDYRKKAKAALAHIKGEG